MNINEYNTSEIDLSFIANPPRTGSPCLDTQAFGPEFHVSQFWFEGCRNTAVEPVPAFNGHHIICLHGGGFVFELTETNRQMAEKLAARGFRVSVADYPLAPEHSADYISSWTLRLYDKLLADYPNDIFHFLGDSAGGGLALSVLQLLRDSGVTRRPMRNVLSSPMLDVGMTDPCLSTASEREVIQLKYAGTLYAGNVDLTAPLASPLFGDMTDLGVLLITWDEDEVFANDCKKMVAMSGQYPAFRVKSITVKGLYHDFAMAADTAEANHAFEQFCTFFLCDN